MDVSESDLRATYDGCRDLVRQCFWGLERLAGLLHGAERSGVSKSICAEWRHTIDGIYRFWPIISLFPSAHHDTCKPGSIADIIRRAAAAPRGEVVLLGQGREYSYVTAHDAAARIGHSFINRFNLKGYETAVEETLANEVGRAHLRRNIDEFPRAGIDWFFARLSIELSLALEWLQRTETNAPPIVYGIVLHGPSEPVLVDGKEKDPIPAQRYRCLMRLIEAYPAGVRLNEFPDEIGDPHHALKCLREDPDFAREIVAPQRSGRKSPGYRLARRGVIRDSRDN
jgi:hypothetical protein